LKKSFKNKIQILYIIYLHIFFKRKNEDKMSIKLRKICQTCKLEMKSKENKLQIGRNNWDAMMNMKLYYYILEKLNNIKCYYLLCFVNLQST